MDIKIPLLFAVFLGGWFFSSKGNTPKNRRSYIIFMMILLTMESCLRGLSVGSDTANYYYMFNSAGAEYWDYIWQAMKERYIEMTGTKDMGFVVYNKLIYMIWPNFSFLLFISALTFFVPFGKLLIRYTKDFSQLIFIFVLYVSLFNMIAMSGVRKEIALGFTVWAFMFYVDKDYKKCAICVFLGTMIHMTTLLFLLVPAIGLLRKNLLRLLHISAFALIPIVIAFSGPIILLMAEASGNDRYSAYGEGGAQGGAMMFTLLMEMISLFCLYVFRNVDFSKQIFLSKLYIMLPCFTFFAPLITNNGSMIRISQYFHLYIVLLLPYAIDMYFVNNRKFIYTVLVIVLIMLSLSAGYLPYTFIWDDNLPRY